MLQSIVGPPIMGVADLKSKDQPFTEKSQDLKKAGSDSFSNVLKNKEEMRPSRADSPRPTVREKVPDKTEKISREDRRPPESETKAEKLKATDDKGTVKKAKGSSQRQDAILNFMDSFESEFGVPPTRIVEAMANLQPNDQAESPEMTADQVIDQLGLDDQQEDQAKEMYAGLLAQLAKIDNNQQPKPLAPAPETQAAGAAMTGAMAFERSASANEKREVLNKSLDTMNQKFWMKGDFKTGTTGVETPLADKLAQISLQEKMLQPQGIQVDESVINSRFADLAAKVSPEELQQALQDLAAQKAETGETPSPEAALAALVAAARAAKGQAGESEDFAETPGMETAIPAESLANQTQVKGEVPKMMEASSKDSGFTGQQQQQQAQDGLYSSASRTAKGEIQAKTKGAEKADFKKTLGLEGLHQQPPSIKGESLAAAPIIGAQANTPAPTASENEANIRQLMNQAQYLVKKGGGEMKVQMSPEGLGQIHMKVLVQDGKVNVQMAADTHEAKKTLESGLSDLKNSLAAHKLSMDHVKVDVVNSTNTDNSAQQNQMNQNDGSREQTRQFWNRFSENFGSPNGQRDGFTDVPNLRGYKRPRTESMLEPVQTAGVKKYAAAGKGKGLDLVA